MRLLPLRRGCLLQDDVRQVRRLDIDDGPVVTPIPDVQRIVREMWDVGFSNRTSIKTDFSDTM